MIHTPEGRAIPSALLPEGGGGKPFVYEYQYTDHLGNLRMTFREAKAIAPMKASMEEAPLQTKMLEEQEFANVLQTRDGTYSRGISHKSAKLNGATTPLGPWKSIPTNTGDKVQVKVYGKYVQPASNNNLKLLPFITSNPQYSTEHDGALVKSPYSLENLRVGLSVSNLGTPSAVSGVPNAYLAVLEYDEAGVLVQQKYSSVTLAFKNNNFENSLEIDNFTASTKGRVEIFLANESDVNVWFDDLVITYEGALIAEEKHYYPYGMEIVSLGKSSLPTQRFTFNGQSEKQKDLNGGSGYVYETPFRGYDPQLGRFHQIDALAGMYSGISPYQFAFNNPVNFNDPTGLQPSPDERNRPRGIGHVKPVESQGLQAPEVNVSVGGVQGVAPKEGENQGESGGSQDPWNSKSNLDNSDDYKPLSTNDLRSLASEEYDGPEYRRNIIAGNALEIAYSQWSGLPRNGKMYKSKHRLKPVKPDFTRGIRYVNSKNGTQYFFSDGAFVEVKATQNQINEKSFNKQIIGEIDAVSKRKTIMGFSPPSKGVLNFTLVVTSGTDVNTVDLATEATNGGVQLFLSYAYQNKNTGGVVFSVPDPINFISLGSRLVPFAGVSKEGVSLNWDKAIPSWMDSNENYEQEP
jgi:RHS repeat-associated protein